MKEWESKIENLENQLDELSQGLNDYWFEGEGIVTDIHICWGKEWNLLTIPSGQKE